jgi:thiosulfate/3-mercaptopyruvate sulfurtransferase
VLRVCCALAFIAAAQPAVAPGHGAGGAPLLIDVAMLAATLKAPDLVLLHVADRAAVFEDGHIPGARFLRYGDFAVEGDPRVGSELPTIDALTRVLQAAGVSKSSRVVVYGTSTVAAARAFFTLDVTGHPRVALLDGGLRAWRAAKQPIETGAVAAAKVGDFVPVINSSRLASAQQIQAQMAAKGIALVDVRPDPEYLGTDGGAGGMHAAGHIDGAKQLTWDSLTSAEGLFLPRDQLAQRLAAAGVTAGRPVVAYCMVGMRASVVYFVARMLGHDVRLYDGSIVDWTARKLPVTTMRQ